MKNKAAGFLKKIVTALTAMAKDKTVAFKSKTKAIKTRLVIFSLLQNKKLLMSSITQKLNSVMGHHHHRNADNKSSKELENGGRGGDQQSQAIVVYNINNAMWVPSSSATQTEMEMETEYKYPDLTHSLFDSEDMEFEDPGESVIDIVKNSKEDKGEEFRLEDEIDRVADLFIRRFHRQIRLQKQLSLKREQEMLEGSV